MTQTAAVFTAENDSAVAGQDLGRQIRAAFHDQPPDAVIVFASARFDHAALLHALVETCQPGVLVGSSSAGEFTGDARGEGSACALAVRSPDMHFAAGVGTGVGKDRPAAAKQVVATFRGSHNRDYPYRAALVMTDALAGHADDLIEELTVATSGAYEFAGGGAGDDAKFARTHVFHGTRVLDDAVVALEILSTKPLGIGVQHGWQPASEPLRVTEVEGARLIALDGFPAVEAFEHHAAQTGQQLDRAAPLPFFLHNIIGIATPSGHRLRVPLSIDADGAVTCAAEIPAGSRVNIMKTSSASAAEAAAEAARSAVRALGATRPAGALFFDCVATRLRMGDVFGFELEAVQAALGGSNLVGCNTYGQIARAAGQFGGFHNCTAVVLAFPQ
ncbi:MAG: FIST C-terminal domain-containing protein [Deltaproteobacteria bacterium]|nr:FIST C-terminal domain-containing protein [Deltaproteobacteria bacterium]MDQ3298885.1 FIST C-terminal domain-containing protein [Myxococcota bacterium]